MRGSLVKWLGLDELPDAWPQGVTPDVALSDLRRTMLQVLRTVTGVAGIFYLVVGLFHITLHPAPLRYITGALSAVNGSALLATHFAIRRDRLPPARIGLAVFLLALLTVAQNLVHSALNPQPALVGVMVMLLLVVALVLPSTRLLLLFNALTLLGFGFVSAYSGQAASLAYYALLLAVVVFLGLPLHLIFQTVILRLHAHRLADRARTTELEVAVSDLQALQSKYELLAQNVSDVIWIRDLDFRAIYVSPSVERQRGCRASEAMCHSPEESLSPESLARVRAWVTKELAREREGGADPDGGHVLPLDVPHRDGHLVATEARVRFLRDADGTPVGLVGVSRDVSERRAAELRLEHVLGELKRSNQELEQFAYIASHDLKEPLRVVASQLRLLERRSGEHLDEKGKRYLGHAVGGALRMQELIDGLLAYSRYGASAISLQPVALEAVLDEVRQSLHIALGEAGATLTWDSLPQVNGDRAKLTHLFQNLVANAIKFRRAEAPLIRIGLSSEAENSVVVTVRDNGIGIDPVHHERVFRLFERLHTREEYEGTGIGLALCKRIVEQHGGQIWVESTPGEGSVFFCRLPRTEKDRARP